MIFKTLESDINKVSSKWGMFGRSFSDIGTAITGRLSDIKKGLQDTDSFTASMKNSDSIWKRLYPDKETVKSRLIDVDSVIPKIDPNNFDSDTLISKLNTVDKQVKEGKRSWQDYYNKLDDNQKWIAKWGQETEGQIRTQEDLVKANEAARTAAINQNKAIKAQTLSFKAAQVAAKAFSMAFNMLAMWAIGKAIEMVVKAIDNYIHKAEKAREATKDAIDQLKDISAEVETIEGKISDLAKQMDELNPFTDADRLKNLKLETDELNEQLAILKEKERIEKNEADMTAQKSLNMTQASRYATETVPETGKQTPQQVTQHQELELAIGKLEEYYKQSEALNREIENLDYEDKRKKVLFLQYLNGGIKETRKHANELALSIQEQAEGLSGDTDASKALQASINTAVDKYINFLDTVSSNIVDTPIGDIVGKKILSAFSELQSEAIESYKNILSSITDIHENPEDYDLAKLMTMFQSYDWSGFLSGAEDLDAVLKNIATDSLQNVIKQFDGLSGAEPILNELKQALVDTFQFDFGLSKSSSAFYELNDLLHKVQDGTVFHREELSLLIRKYPELESAIKKVTGGYALEEEAVRSLTETYAKSLDSSFFSQRESILSKITDSIRTGTTSAQGTIAPLNEGIIDIFDLPKSTGLSELLEELNTLEELQESFHKALDELSSSPTTIDWASNSIQNLQERVDALQTAFNDTKGIEAQKAALSDLNKETAKLRDSYYSLTDNSDTIYGKYEKSYREALQKLGDDSSSIRSKIEAGDVFHTEEFSSDIAELINNAIDAWNQMRDAKKKYLELDAEWSDNSLKALELDSEHFSSLKALTQSKLETSVSDNDRLKLYEELEGCLSRYYDTETAIAKLKQDSTVVSSLELERQKELADIEQKRLELVREQTEAELSQITSSQNRILNSIDLNGGNAAAKDYNALLQLGKKELEARNQEYERELALLLDIETSLGQNSTEYREQLSKVDGIADAIDTCKKNTKDWAKSLLSLPVKQIEESIEDLNKKLNTTQDSIDKTDAIIAGAQAYIQDEIDGQEKLKEAVQNQLTSLQKANEERSRSLALQKAQYELERAYSQRTVKVYREGEGFVYEQSLDDIRSARENYDNASYEKATASLEKQLEYYDGIISDLEKVKDKWGSISGDAQDFLHIQEAISAIGTNGIFNSNVIDGYARLYTGMLRSKEDTETTIRTMEDFKEAVEEAVEQYSSGVATYEECMSAIEQLVSSFYGKSEEQGILALEKIKAILDQMREQFDSADGTAQMEAAARTSEDLTKKLQAETEAQAGIMQNFANEVNSTFRSVCETSSAEAAAAFQSLGESVVQTAATIKEQLSVISYQEREPLLVPSGNGILDYVQENGLGINPVKLPEIRSMNITQASIQSSSPTPVVQNINVTLPNVTNESGYNNFVQTVKHLPLDTIQYISK